MGHKNKKNDEFRRLMESIRLNKEKIGDILVFDDGADIIILDEIEKFLLSNLGTLTRFNKSDIEVISLNEIRKNVLGKVAELKENFSECSFVCTQLYRSSASI